LPAPCKLVYTFRGCRPFTSIVLIAHETDRVNVTRHSWPLFPAYGDSQKDKERTMVGYFNRLNVAWNKINLGARNYGGFRTTPQALSRSC